MCPLLNRKSDFTQYSLYTGFFIHSILYTRHYFYTAFLIRSVLYTQCSLYAAFLIRSVFDTQRSCIVTCSNMHHVPLLRTCAHYFSEQPVVRRWRLIR